jgi:predicted patatin/cPLA2 family phospholipase
MKIALIENQRGSVRALLAAIGCVLLLAGCANIARVPHTVEEQRQAEIPGFSGIRNWADDLGDVSHIINVSAPRPTMLALSGGGPDGAFGAGFLTGWGHRGTRPEFDIVTGASAGALIAPFAFLGEGYDSALRDVFTSGEMNNFLQFQGVSGLFGTGLFNNAPLQRLIARNVDEAMLAAVAREHNKGRRLFIVTTNLDAQRTAIWNMGKIANSGQPNALQLFREIMEASASVPGVFSPVLINVEANGRRFAEMHVDGGITSNVLVVPESVLLQGQGIFPPNSKPTIYVLINGRLDPNFEVIKPNTLRIAIRAFMTSVHSNTRNTMLASYQFARRQGWNFYVAAISSDFTEPDQMNFDPAYMNALFDYGYERGRQGQMWQRSPADSRERRAEQRSQAARQ